MLELYNDKLIDLFAKPGTSGPRSSGPLVMKLWFVAGTSSR